MGTGGTVVIGAGPAGLASAAELRRRGVPAVVLERGDGIASSWRGRYDRLRLNTSRWFSKLPGRSYAPGTAVFPTPDEVVSYLEDYARDNALDVRLRTDVERIDPDGGGWAVRTSAGDFPAEHVVVAAGYEHTPFVPEWAGRDRFRGSLLHAAEYRNPEPFRDRDVLVVGPGCSGMEIAYDLAEGGARKVRLAVRTPPNILIRSPMGPAFALALMRVRPQRADRVVNFLRSKEVGDLTEFGLPVPEEGTFSRLRRLGVAPAIVDKVVIEDIRERRIEIVASIESLDETGAELVDGAHIEADAVIAATGYRTGLEPMVGHLGVLDDDGAPRAFAPEAAAPGLRFVGYLHIPARRRSPASCARGPARRRAARWRPTARPSRMSPANIELLAEAFAGWGKDRPANMRELLHPDCVLEVPDSVPYGGTFRGAEAAIAWFTRELWRWFDEFTSTPEDLIDGGDRIVLPVHVRARARNGATMDVHNVWIYEFSEGKLVKARVYADTAVLRDTVAGITPG